MQRIYNWRSDFGESAIIAVKNYWKDNKLLTRDERASCAAFHISDGDPYLYGHVKTAKQDGVYVVEVHVH